MSVEVFDANVKIESGYSKKTKHYNTDEWKQSALHFEEFGRYTNYPPNSHQSSRFYKFWEEEARRCVYGYNIGRDWIPGYFYWYLNYCPIFIAKEQEEEDQGHEAISEVELIMKKSQADRELSFPHFWDGDYQYYHYLEEAEQSGEHAVVIKTRGRGYSFKGGSMCDRNYYLIPGSKSYCFADDKEYLIEDGILTKAWDMMDHVEQHTPWGKRRHRHDSIMHKRSSYYKIEGGRKIEKGFKSEIIGVTLKNNWNKARGKRGKLILFEESGKNPHLLKAWNIALKSLQYGRLTFGLQVAFGTGGTEDVDFMGLEQLFYEGGGYNVHMVPNIWDDAAGNSKCGHFVSVMQNYEGAMDKDGNSDYTLAEEAVDIERELIKRETKNPEAIIRHIAEEPKNPQEASLRIGGNWFPINDLKLHLAEVRTNPELYQDMEYIGELNVAEDGTIKWSPNDSLRPIRTFPNPDTKDLSGAIVIYEQPVMGDDGKPPPGIYLAGIDPYDHDDSTTTSLGSTFIMNKLTQRIVAEYTGRPLTAYQYYENVRRLLLYYNARANYENDVKGIFPYFENRYSSYLFCETPKLVAEKVYDRTVLNRKYGTPGTEPINKWGRELILKYLLTPVSPDSNIMYMHKIRSIPLLQELIYWHKEGNFDRISALGMLMIYNEDVANYIPTYESVKPKISEFFLRQPMFQAKMNERINKNPFEDYDRMRQLKRQIR